MLCLTDISRCSSRRCIELSVLPNKRSNSFGCGVIMVRSGKNDSQVLFSAMIFNASASRTIGTFASWMRCFKAVSVFESLPSPGPAPMAVYGSKSGSFEKQSSDLSTLIIASGRYICSGSIADFGRCVVSKPTPERMQDSDANKAAPVLPVEPAINKACP